MVVPRGGHTATLLADGRVLVAGGWLAGTDATDQLLDSAELYDPATGTWRSTAGMVEMRRGHTATLLPDGSVLVAGGYIDDGANGTVPSASAELYSPATGAWSATAPMTDSRTFHVAVLLPAGRVLVAGSVHSSATAELYDPTTATWTPTGSMVYGRHDFRAVLLLDGTVLIAGGEGRAQEVELYDPGTQTWRETGLLTDGGNGFFTLTLLSDGTVLASGMEGSAERYDPAARTWTLTGGDDPTAQDHSATLLRDGRVLTVGGRGDSASAHLYRPGN
jgi:hypothetical protein